MGIHTNEFDRKKNTKLNIINRRGKKIIEHVNKITLCNLIQIFGAHPG